jgi:hypothetical protein
MLPVVMAILVLGGVLALGVFMYRWQRGRGEAMLSAWAEREHLRLLEREPANPPGTGPMDRNASNKQIVYRIKAEDRSGQIRRGTVRLGSATTGVLSDAVTVEWDR